MNSDPNKFDRLLGEFFRAELPSAWPPAPRTTLAATRARPAADPLSQSRFALAASIAALLLGGWLLAGRLSVPPNRPASFDDTTATRPPEMRFGK